MNVLNKGATAPFFIPAISELALQAHRYECLISQALESYSRGDISNALLYCEIVCRFLPGNEYAAILRARLLEQQLPATAHKAHFQAWKVKARSPITQDNLLRNWLKAGVTRPVIELGWNFLAQRIRSENSTELTSILKQAGAEFVSACWANQSQLVVDYEFFDQTKISEYDLLLINHTEIFRYGLTSAKQRLIFSELSQDQVWSVCWQRKADGLELVSSGSPVRLAPVLTQAEISDQAVFSNEILIIIPVYRGCQQVQACVNSVLQSFAENYSQASILIIDDASPENELRAWLANIATHPKVSVIQNRINLGFIESVNRGLTIAAGKHAILLNSDTLVTGNWLDLMLRSLLSHADIGSVSAWSNNGEVSSFPIIAKANLAPDELELKQLQHELQLAADLAQIDDQEIPVCCGFAMMIHAQAIRQVGLLDGYSLQRGYGEEVEWCLRASAMGYRHLLNPRVFVAHYGTSSFRSEKVYRVSQNLNLIYQRYPEYQRYYRNFIVKDGLIKARKRLLLALKRNENSWLKKQIQIENTSQHIVLPPASSVDRNEYIVIWDNQIANQKQEIIMQLAYQLSAMPEKKLKLLIFGDAFDKLWGTGICYVLPKNHDLENSLIVDKQFLSWLNIKFILTFDAALFAADSRVKVIDKDFKVAKFIAEI